MDPGDSCGGPLRFNWYAYGGRYAYAGLGPNPAGNGPKQPEAAPDHSRLKLACAGPRKCFTKAIPGLPCCQVLSVFHPHLAKFGPHSGCTAS